MNDQIARVTSFEVLDDYTLRLHFADDAERTINFEPILQGPIFGPLREREHFAGVELDPLFGTLQWPATGADIDPNVLYHWHDHVERIAARHRSLLAAA